MRKIPLRYGQNGLFVTGLVVNQRFSPRPVDFLIDTGASSTSISPKDQFLLDIDPKDMGLPRTRRRIVTAGGKTSAFDLVDSLICLLDEEGKPVNLEAGLSLIMERMRATSKSKRDRERQRINESTPSIIGRDFLEEHRMSLHVDFGTKEARLLSH